MRGARGEAFDLQPAIACLRCLSLKERRERAAGKDGGRWRRAGAGAVNLGRLGFLSG